MSDLVFAITGGAETFTPDCLVGIIVFVTIFEGLCRLAGQLSKGVRR